MYSHRKYHSGDGVVGGLAYGKFLGLLISLVQRKYVKAYYGLGLSALGLSLPAVIVVRITFKPAR